MDVAAVVFSGLEGRLRAQEDSRVRVLLIDDYQPFLAVVANLLRRQPGVEVVGQAYAGGAGLCLAAELKPDLVLVDFGMPDMDGVAVTRRLKQAPDAPRVVVMSFFQESRFRDEALDAGADAYLYKGDLHRELVPLLRRGLSGA